MKVSLIGGTAAASALLVAVGAAMAVASQDTSRTTPQQGQGSRGSGQQESAQQGRSSEADKRNMEQIGTAYKELHQVTLRVLQEKTRNWKDDSKSGSATESDTERSTFGSAAQTASSTSIRGQEMLIAACSEGLLAGAPSGMGSRSGTFGSSGTSGTSGSESTTSGSQQDRPGQTRGSGSMGAGSSGGETIGMFLVCEHSTSGMPRVSGLDGQNQRRVGEASSDRDSAIPRAGGMGMGSGKLVPGVYSVKQTGQSVWLTDQEGQVVLRTTMEQRGAHSGMTPDRSRGQGQSGGTERGTGGGMDRDSGETGQVGQGAITTNAAGSDSQWEEAFGAITKEAMSALGWGKQGSATLSR